MNNKTAGFFAFIFGAAAGSIVTWWLLKNYYKEIDSVKEVFCQQTNRVDEERTSLGDSDEVERKDAALRSRNKIEISELVSISQRQGYRDYSTIVPTSAQEEFQLNDEEIDDGLTILSPEEFSESENEKVTLIYWNNGVVSYEDGELPSDYTGLVGKDFAQHFGEYEDDSVFVRNERMGIDYEILADGRDYSEVFSKIT